MPSPIERRRNNIRAGTFVTGAMILVLVVISVLANVWEGLSRKTREYTVSYPVASGVGMLDTGSEVRVGGLLMGKVLDVRPHVTDGQFDMIDVRFSIDRQATLYADAQILVGSPILGTAAWLDVRGLGTADAGSAPGGRIAGVPVGGMLASMLGPEDAAKAGEIVENTRQFSVFLADVPDEYEARVVPILDDAKATAGDVRSLASTIREDDWPRWSARVDQTLTWAVDFEGRLDAALATGHDFLRDGRDVITGNRDRIDSIVRNVETASVDVAAVTERVRTESMEKLDALLETGRTALDNANAAIETLRTDYDGWAVDVGETLAGAALAAQQLKLTLIEVRRSPWKVLYRPTDEELQHELLYDAARSFAMATADLKAAALSTERVLTQHGELIGSDPELMTRVRKNLVDPLQNYETAQTRLLDILFEEQP